MTDFSTWQQANLISFCEQSNNRMREQKDCIKTLTNRIDEISEMIDHQREEAIENERMYLTEFAKLRAELAQAKLYTPGRRSEAIPKTEHGEFCKKYWWNQTDEKSAASGKPYVEVTE